MDLGLKNRHAVVCGASKGLGYACAEALAREGARVTLIARNETELIAAGKQLRESSGAQVEVIAADVSTEAGRASIVEQTKHVDILINNAGGPPPGQYADWSREDWIAALEANMLSGIFLIKAFLPAMLEQRHGRIVNITSVTVKQPQALLGLSTAARLGLTGYVATVAREVIARGVTINNLLPGYFLTDRLRSMFESWDSQAGENVPVSEQKRLAIPAQRFGTPSEFGDVCAFLCSRSAGYMTAQNILLDGGLYPGTF
ncbi:SDR family oxidoreductase [Paraburkholderia unamae]|uniref:3-oxoacyl-[acyl-carrier protein] reductase n=1 Tax=Paraburkholderia unamae TaxID=219649 RepID=A0ABX5KLM0_9BURK|nr:SDR family oxidoreductase [Paraburkholderia unamae]PVX80008.1 3-oxoacyl-[acyl-carrier protein] reductase [Paraburkholderia unamae]RAR52269.1 3-oxoacyl-[acyl-carrier protein] reductase [Paraburkholderia unamae]CAG9268632.1 3-oxoacyl-ACP reductase [Paraburkholderia unamae]